jgi:broad specificity phosphatase PhoE
MRIYIVRHGESTGDIDDMYGGDYDDHLSEKGKSQAKDLAKRLSSSGLEIIYHSPLLRAKETAEIVAIELELPMKEVLDIKERDNYGILTGLSKTQGMDRYPIEAKKLLKSKTFHTVKRSEPYEVFNNRIQSAFNTIFKNSEYKVIGLFTHGGPLSLFVREVLKIGEVSYEDCAYIEIEKKNGTFTVLSKSGIKSTSKAE